MKHVSSPYVEPIRSSGKASEYEMASGENFHFKDMRYINYKPFNASSSRVVIFYKRQDSKGWCHDFCVKSPHIRTIEPKHIMQITRDDFGCWLDKDERLLLKLDGGKKVPEASKLENYVPPATQYSQYYDQAGTEGEDEDKSSQVTKEDEVEKLKTAVRALKESEALGIHTKQLKQMIEEKVVAWRGTHERICYDKLKLNIEYGKNEKNASCQYNLNSADTTQHFFSNSG